VYIGGDIFELYTGERPDHNVERMFGRHPVRPFLVGSKVYIHVGRSELEPQIGLYGPAATQESLVAASAAVVAARPNG
jgi:hypothetical protein